MNTKHNPFRRRDSILFAIAMSLVAACGNADATSESQPEAATVEVTAVDFGFEGLPETVVVGTTLTLINESDMELHELVALKLPEDETRTVEELVAQPQDLAPLFPSVTTVIIAPPGEDGVAVEGTGRIDQPGRYAIICAIPTGADPLEYMEAAAESEGGPPEVSGGPPHFAHGMYAELIVEG